MNLWTVFAMELRMRWRDRASVVLAFVAPVVLAAVTSLAFANFDKLDPVKLALVDHDRGALSAQFIKELQTDPRLRQLLRLRVVDSTSHAETLVRQGRSEAVLVIPEGFSTAVVNAQRPPSLLVLSTDQKPIAGSVAQAVAQEFDTRASAVTLAAKTTQQLVEGQPHGGVRKSVPVGTGAVPFPRQASTKPLKTASYFAPSMTIVFLFFAVSFGARNIWVERRQKTLMRSSLSGASVRTVVAGKLAAAYVFGVLASLSAWATTSLVFKTTWGPPGAVLMLIAAMSAAAVGVSLVVATVVRREEQLDTVTAVVSFVLVLLGGNFIPPSSLPATIRHVSLATPNGWAMRGFLDSVTTAHAGAAVGAALVTLAYAVVLFVVGGVRVKGLLQR